MKSIIYSIYNLLIFKALIDFLSMPKHYFRLPKIDVGIFLVIMKTIIGLLMKTI